MGSRRLGQTKNLGCLEATEVSGSIWICEQGATLFAGANCASQAAIVHAVGGMPKRLTKFDSAAEHLDFLRTARGGVRSDEVFILLRAEVFIVTITKDCFEDVLTMSHAFSEFPETPRPVRGIRGYKNLT
ncbi:hypothetical protein Poly21_42190 [Allorhodopirellula heiligendammensis]|uniref:Uncharacterized protein n=1 Tax=Allorhodopirellula heiligendammensis TaxID=2714739 RepID=A0A5C6BXG3_9BACT|nr:hypothetical protein Poly21_42190 [Allorhodopirellula heiligendammensis]